MRVHIIITGALIALNCSCRQLQTGEAAELTSTVTLRARELALIEMILREQPPPPSDRIYFLTVTPMSQWGDDGRWASLPKSFHERIADLKPQYRPASEAFLKDNQVLQRGTNKQAWMQWISIKRWISNTEVEVEKGVWCCPLGGGASTVIYEYRDGAWHFKDLKGVWVS